MPGRKGLVEHADGRPVGAQGREYWPTQRVFACLGAVTVLAAALPIAALPRVRVAIPVVHDFDGYAEHFDWSTLFLPQDMLGSAQAQTMRDRWRSGHNRALRIQTNLTTKVVLLCPTTRMPMGQLGLDVLV